MNSTKVYLDFSNVVSLAFWISRKAKNKGTAVVKEYSYSEYALFCIMEDVKILFFS